MSKCCLVLSRGPVLLRDQKSQDHRPQNVKIWEGSWFLSCQIFTFYHCEDCGLKGVWILFVVTKWHTRADNWRFWLHLLCLTLNIFIWLLSAENILLYSWKMLFLVFLYTLLFSKCFDLQGKRKASYSLWVDFLNLWKGEITHVHGMVWSTTLWSICTCCVPCVSTQPHEHSFSISSRRN